MLELTSRVQMVPPGRIELPTSPLPRARSTTELRRHVGCWLKAGGTMPQRPRHRQPWSTLLGASRLGRQMPAPPTGVRAIFPLGPPVMTIAAAHTTFCINRLSDRSHD